MPAESDVEVMKQYTVKRISAMVTDEYLLWDAHAFTELRDLLVSRLTLFNARRGGEPARLLLSEWHDAENNSWIDVSRLESMITDVDRELFHSMKVTFQGGKGNNHLVPVLFPLDTISAMRKLIDVRDSAGISKTNRYMFPCVQASEAHVSGWHAVRRICTEAELKDPQTMTATKMRHRISTLYAAMDLPENDRNVFYKHMGHSASINQNIYQVPLAAAEIMSVGSRLKQLDGSVIAKHAAAAASKHTESIPQLEAVNNVVEPGSYLFVIIFRYVLLYLALFLVFLASFWWHGSFASAKTELSPRRSLAWLGPSSPSRRSLTAQLQICIFPK